MANTSRADIRRKIHGRIRKKVSGTSERPRLSVFRSVKHIYAQIIDDVKSETLAAASTNEGEFKGKTGGNLEAAAAVGKLIAERAAEKGIEQVVYDRGGYVYHGRVKSLIDASREAGLNKNGADDSKAKKADKGEDQPKAEEKSDDPKKEEKVKEDKKATEKKSDKKSDEKVEDKKESKKEEKPKADKKAKKEEAEDKVEEESADAQADEKAGEEEE